MVMMMMTVAVLMVLLTLKILPHVIGILSIRVILRFYIVNLVA